MPGSNTDVGIPGGLVRPTAEILPRNSRQTEYGTVIPPSIGRRRPDCVFEAAKGLTEAVDDLAGDTVLFAAAGRNTVTLRSKNNGQVTTMMNHSDNIERDDRPQCFAAMWLGSDEDSEDEMNQLFDVVIKPGHGAPRPEALPRRSAIPQ